MGLFRRESREAESSSVTIEDVLLSSAINDTDIGKEEAMNIPAYAGCVNRIADIVSTIPLKLYKHEENGIVEVKDDKRVFLLNKETGDTLDAVQFKRAMVVDMLNGRGGYAYINKVLGNTESIHYVDETQVSFMQNSDPIFKSYSILVNGGTYQPYQFIKLLRNTKDGHEGVSVIDENRKILSVAYNSLIYEESLVKTGGNKKGFLESTKKLSQDAMNALKNAFRVLYKNNNENVVVLNEGLSFKEASNTSVEMELNDSKIANTKSICSIFNMPPNILLGGATDEDKKRLIDQCVLPVLARFECAINRDLLKESEKDSYFFAADTVELTKGDIEKRFAAYETACKNGFMQIDEVRKKENLPELGLKFIKLGLQDVLYNPETGSIYTPNTDKSSNVDNPESTNIKMEEGEKIED